MHDPVGRHDRETPAIPASAKRLHVRQASVERAGQIDRAGTFGLRHQPVAHCTQCLERGGIEEARLDDGRRLQPVLQRAAGRRRH